jgi:hypothetical protein
MAKKSKGKGEKPHESLGERIHDRFVAAEVAAEEAAGYGSLTTAVEAVEGAADPDREAQAANDPAKKESPAPAD